MRDNTFLLRHVKSDTFYHGEFVNHCVFMPRASEDWQLSVYDGENLSAKELVDRWHKKYPGTIIAVVAVTPKDCLDVNGVDLPILPDEEADFKEHMVIDFRGLPSNKSKDRAAKILKERALVHGFLWEDKEEI